MTEVMSKVPGELMNAQERLQSPEASLHPRKHRHGYYFDYFLNQNFICYKSYVKSFLSLGHEVSVEQ